MLVVLVDDYTVRSKETIISFLEGRVPCAIRVVYGLEEWKRFLVTAKGRLKALVIDSDDHAVFVPEAIRLLGHDPCAKLLLVSDDSVSKAREYLRFNPELDHAAIKPLGQPALLEAVFEAVCRRKKRMHNVLVWYSLEPEGMVSKLERLALLDKRFHWRSFFVTNSARELEARVDRDMGEIGAVVVDVRDLDSHGGQAIREIFSKRERAHIPIFMAGKHGAGAWEMRKLVAYSSDYPSEAVLEQTLTSMADTMMNHFRILSLWREAAGLAAAGSANAALRVLSSILKIDPCHAGAYSMSARILAERGYIKKARQFVRYAIQFRPHHVGNHLLLVQSLGGDDRDMIRAREFCPNRKEFA